MEEIAQGGNSDVQYNLGLIYSNGEDVEKDLSKAIFWFKKSASQDNILAQYKLGYIYDNGLGVKKDPTKAYQYYLCLRLYLLHILLSIYLVSHLNTQPQCLNRLL